MIDRTRSAAFDMMATICQNSGVAPITSASEILPYSGKNTAEQVPDDSTCEGGDMTMLLIFACFLK